jgi:hypothetical protein
MWTTESRSKTGTCINGFSGNSLVIEGTIYLSIHGLMDFSVFMGEASAQNRKLE